MHMLSFRTQKHEIYSNCNLSVQSNIHAWRERVGIRMVENFRAAVCARSKSYLFRTHTSCLNGGIPSSYEYMLQQGGVYICISSYNAAAFIRSGLMCCVCSRGVFYKEILHVSSCVHFF